MIATAEAHRRKMFAGVAMIVAPLLLAVAYVGGPASSSDTAEQVRELAAHPTQVEIFGLFYVLAGLFMVYVALALVHLLREKQPWLGQIGGVLVISGLVLDGVTTGAFVAVTETARIDVANAAAALDALESNIVLLAAYAGEVAVTIGMITLAVGLLRARTAPTWSVWALGIGVVLDLVGGLVTSDVTSLIGVAAVFLALAPLGWQLIAEPDEAWIHPAPFEGFRPVGAH